MIGIFAAPLISASTEKVNTDIDFDRAAQKLYMASVVTSQTAVVGTAPSPVEEFLEAQEEEQEAVADEMVLELPPAIPERDEIQKICYTTEVQVGEERNIISVKVPEKMENNVSTGHSKIDVLMAGDGVTPSTACLLTGIPGSGKSTLAFQMADAITGQGHIALYNSCEESAVQISKVARRLRLRHGFFASALHSVYDIVKHAKTFQEKYPDKQVFLFVDSLQTVDVPSVETDEKFNILLDSEGQPIKKKGRVSAGQTVQVETAQILTSWCKETYGVCFIIGQVNKDGEFAGRQAIKHWVDAHMHLDINKDRASGDYGCRTAEMTKNRFGLAGAYYPFEIEARGIKFTEPKVKK